jgi:hypothetical protein
MGADLMAERQPPRPALGTTARHLTRTLRELRRWAHLTLDGLHDLDRTLPRSTVSAVERGERGLTWQFVSSFVTTCLREHGLPPAAVRKELSRWREALDTVRSDHTPMHNRNTTPRDIADFTGREKELQQLVRRVTVSDASPKILAVDGMGGVGKTALVVRLAHMLAARYPDGQLFINLQAHAVGQHPLEPAEALRRLLAMLDASPTERPRRPAEWAEVWRAELRRRRLLVVLDDAAGSYQVEPLLPGRSDSLVLITSRRRLAGLHVGGAMTYSLDVLPRDAAAALFVRVVGVDRADERSADVDRVVRRCGMLPLAVRLSASRLALRPTWTVADLADELEQAEQRLDALRAEDLSVRAAFAQSYLVLSTGDAKMFRRLGLHPTGEFGLGAAAALAGTDPGHVEAVLERLVAHNLVLEIGRRRYRLHDLVHEYARECATTGEPRTERGLLPLGFGSRLRRLSGGGGAWRSGI